jgi:hypothetical protein
VPKKTPAFSGGGGSWNCISGFIRMINPISGEGNKEHPVFRAEFLEKR